MMTRSYVVYMLDGSTQKKHVRPYTRRIFAGLNGQFYLDVATAKTTKGIIIAQIVCTYGGRKRLDPAFHKPSPWFEVADTDNETLKELLKKWMQGTILSELMLR